MIVVAVIRVIGINGVTVVVAIVVAVVDVGGVAEIAAVVAGVAAMGATSPTSISLVMPDNVGGLVIHGGSVMLNERIGVCARGRRLDRSGEGRLGRLQAAFIVAETLALAAGRKHMRHTLTVFAIASLARDVAYDGLVENGKQRRRVRSLRGIHLQGKMPGGGQEAPLINHGDQLDHLAEFLGEFLDLFCDRGTIVDRDAEQHVFVEEHLGRERRV